MYLVRIMAAVVLLAATALPANAAGIRLLEVRGPINAVTSDYLRRNIREAAQQGESLVLLELDTPGGLDTSMREIVREILGSPVPVTAYVTPSGARAASAGAVIALSADICAMSPGTNIGAAHPVSLGEKPDRTMETKLVNDAAAYVEGIAEKRGRDANTAARMVRESLSLPAERALKAGVADLLARDRGELLRELNGRVLRRDGKETLLRTAGVPVTLHEMAPRQKVLDALSNPNVAYILMMLGFIGLFFELSNPGAILPGVIGSISLILALFAFQSLPVNYAGVLLILLALILFIAEVKIVSHGMLTVGGIVSLVLGSLLLFESPEPYLRVSRRLIALTSLVTAGFAVFAVTMAVRAQRRRPVSGAEGLVGETGRTVTPLDPAGKIFVRGEYWDAVANEPVAEGERVEVTAVEGMTVRVRRVRSEE
jgi:membrane-bound serine protease (ClpP class)